MSAGYFSLVLHAHLPFVRHPEHERFLEESWLFEGITECYLPLLEVLEGWRRDQIPARITLTLSPTLCSMLQDPLLQQRHARRLDELAELTAREIHRTIWDESLQRLATFYHRRFVRMRELYAQRTDLTAGFKEFQELGLVEIITTAATHGLLPLLASHPPSLRAQILTARDHYRGCFGRNPRGIWLPECAYTPEVEPALREAELRWFLTETHALLHARPQPIYANFAPVFTPQGLAAFARDQESARQVWSRQEGYAGDGRYRDFYRDIGFDLDLDYLRPYLPAPDERGFTGIKYHRIAERHEHKEVYERDAALRVANEHAGHFLQGRIEHFQRLLPACDRPPLIVAPYDAELFGHWWYEGPEFIDFFVRKACCDQQTFRLIAPGDYLESHPENQVVRPSPSSWGEGGHWKVWLDETNEWILPQLSIAQERMSQLARTLAAPSPLIERGLKQAGRELLLAQASDWPFILHAGTTPDYARRRVTEHLLRFNALFEQLIAGQVNESALSQLEAIDNLFPEADFKYWR